MACSMNRSWALSVIVAMGLAGCGIKGPLERPAPLWGEVGEQTLRALPEVTDEDVPNGAVILQDEIFLEPEADPFAQDDEEGPQTLDD